MVDVVFFLEAYRPIDRSGCSQDDFELWSIYVFGDGGDKSGAGGLG